MHTCFKSETFALSPTLEIDELIGRLTTNKNKVLFDDLSASPQLQYKLRALVCTMRRAPVVDKFVAQTTMASSLFCLDNNLSQIFKRFLHKQMQLHPSSYRPTRWDHPSAESQL
jgi:hypothetical protein